MRAEIANPNPESTVIAVIGLGYVGLPVACEFARAGFCVIGLDIKADRVAKIAAGINPIEGNEPGLAELLTEVITSQRLRVITDYSILTEADVVLINVETPVDDQYLPQYHAMRAACRSLGSVLKSGALVIVESTVAPGTTLNVVRPILEEISGYTCKYDGQIENQNQESATFYLGACPERVMPGRLLNNLRNLSRVCGGSSGTVAEAMCKLYRHIIPQADIDPTDILTAELVKTTENAYRDVQIAFANEVALICEAMGGDVWKVREFVNKSPGRNMLLPGAGVGGHCIPKDPWLLIAPIHDQSARIESNHQPNIYLIPAARTVNESMPAHVAEMTINAINKYDAQSANRNPQYKIGILGFSYLEDSDDTRHSPSETLVTLLQRQQIEVAIHDPFVEEYKGDIYERMASCDAVVLMVKHSVYRTIDLKILIQTLRKPILVDGRGFFDRTHAQKVGFVFRGIGQ